MLHAVCAVFDRAAECFGRPVFVAAIGLAARSFTDEVNRAGADNPMYLHPDDYSLHHLGWFDDTEGKFDMFNHPEKLATGATVKVRNETSK